MAERLLPRPLAPGIAGFRAQHLLGNAVAVGGVAPGEAGLDAAMAVIGLAVLVRNHAHQLGAAHLRLEAAADAAIGAGGDDGMLRLADAADRFLQRRPGP